MFAHDILVRIHIFSDMALYLSPIRPSVVPLARECLEPYPPQTAAAAPVSLVMPAVCSVVWHFCTAASDTSASWAEWCGESPLSQMLFSFVCSVVRRAPSAAAYKLTCRLNP